MPEIKCLIPIDGPYWEDILLDTAWNEVLSELRNAGFELKCKCRHEFNALIKSASEFQEIFSRNRVDIKNRDLILQTSVTIPNSHKKAFFRHASLLRKRTEDLLLAANIAKLGIIKNLEGYIFFENQVIHIYKINEVIHNWDSATLLTKSIGWPKLKTIKIRKVWNWLMNFSYDLDHFSKSSIGRALCALTYAIRSNEGFTPVEIFWCLVGLEAIYTNNSDDIRSQVDKNTQLFLGQRKDFEKILKEMYGFRSRFIHGDTNFPSSNYLMEVGSFDPYLEENFKSCEVAVSILLLTIQKMADEGICDLKFKQDTKIDRRFF